MELSIQSRNVQVDDGTLLRAEERAATIPAAVDVVARALDRQVLKYKGRHFRNLRGKKGSKVASIRSQEGEEVTATEEDKEQVTAVLPTGKLVKVKQFPVKAMPVEEAALQMELLGHVFFLFLNGETQQCNVLYRRNDGDYGVIEPKLG